MTINDAEKYVENLWNWAILRGCFGDTKIEPTDVDGLVERNGNFLLMETKSPGVEISEGQKRTFDNLADTGYFSVLLIWGVVNKPEKIVKIVKRGSKLHYKTYDPASLNTLKNIVSSWFRYADSKRHVHVNIVYN